MTEELPTSVGRQTVEKLKGLHVNPAGKGIACAGPLCAAPMKPAGTKGDAFLSLLGLSGKKYTQPQRAPTGFSDLKICSACAKEVQEHNKHKAKIAAAAAPVATAESASAPHRSGQPPPPAPSEANQAAAAPPPAPAPTPLQAAPAPSQAAPPLPLAATPLDAKAAPGAMESVPQVSHIIPASTTVTIGAAGHAHAPPSGSGFPQPAFDSESPAPAMQAAAMSAAIALRSHFTPQEIAAWKNKSEAFKRGLTDAIMQMVMGPPSTKRSRIGGGSSSA